MIDTLKVYTKYPYLLHDSIYDAIDGKLIRTWSYDKDRDLLHTAPQWIYKAWLRPSMFDGGLRFKIIEPKSQKADADTRGIYLGHFSEALIRHFEDDISQITVF